MDYVQGPDKAVVVAELTDLSRRVGNWRRKRDLMAMLYSSGFLQLPSSLLQSETIAEANMRDAKNRRQHLVATTRVLHNSDLIRQIAPYF